MFFQMLGQEVYRETYLILVNQILPFTTAHS